MEEIIKKCSLCKEYKKLSEYYNRSDKKHLFKSRCKVCTRMNVFDSGKRHRDRLRKKQSEYHYKNKEKRNNYNKNYYKNHLAQRRKRFNDRYKNDLNFRLTTNLRNRVLLAIKRNQKSGSTSDLIGCDIPYLKKYIASLFSEGMSWENYGLWQIDHILPCASFDLSKEEEQRRCFNYKNLQPLWEADNRKKWCKMPEEEVCHR